MGFPFLPVPYFLVVPGKEKTFLVLVPWVRRSAGDKSPACTYFTGLTYFVCKEWRRHDHLGTCNPTRTG